MSIISIPNTFSAGAVIVASQHNSNFSTIYSDYNGNIDNTNIVASAGIVASKLDLTSPGPIGNTSANTGKFTNLTATGTVNLGTTHQGDVLYDNGTNIVRLTPGTNGQFLQTQGASANPQWATISQTFSLISTTPVSAATSSGNITIVGTNFYRIIVTALDVSASANQFGIICNGDTGNNYHSGYSGRGSSAVIGASSESVASIVPSTSLVASNSMTIDFYISPYQGAPTNQLVYGTVCGRLTTGGIGTFSSFGGLYGGSVGITSFAVTGAGNWTGNVYLYQIVL